MTNFVYANNISTTLAAAATSTAITLTLASAANLPILPPGYVFSLTLNDAATRMIYEIVYVSAIAGTTLTVMRAQEGTTAQNWSIGDYAFSAVTMGQMQSLQVSAPVVGDARNLMMSVPAASYTATLTADEIVTKSMLGAPAQILPMFNEAINLATTGAGGMDTGAPPDSGYVAIYAIYSPTTGTAALLATNATTTVAPSVYGGAHMPAGYAASALVSVWPTNTTGEFTVASQRGKRVGRILVAALGTATLEATATPLQISTSVPMNAKSVSGFINLTSNTTAALCLLSAGVTSSAASVDVSAVQAWSYELQQIVGDFNVLIETPQTIYYTFNENGATNYYLAIDVTGYSI
jgi:hypothetical protein